MANLYSGLLSTEGAYEKLETLTEVEFTSGKIYTIQIQNPAFVRRGTTGEGFYIFDGKPFQYTADSDDLYVRIDSAYSYVNIDEN